LETLAKREVSTLISELLVVPPSTSVSAVVGLMIEKGAYEVFVEGGRLGMVTARDLLNASNPTATKLSTTMVTAPTLSSGKTILDAARIILEHRIRAVPVVDGRRVLGQVGISSIISAMREHMPKVSADSIMTPSPITLDERDNVSKARSLMRRRRIDHLPILSSGHLAGMVTSSHIISYLLSPVHRVEPGAMVADTRRRTDVEVGSIMDREPIKCEAQEDVRTVASTIAQRRSTYSIVAVDEEVHGIITLRDFMKLIVPPPPKSAVPVYIVGLPDDPFEAETARAKFIGSVNLLWRSFPDILEARSTIKTKDMGGERRRYEVRVHLRTTRRTFSYSEAGYDLANLYDALSDRMKRLMAQKPSKRSEPRSSGTPR